MFSNMNFKSLLITQTQYTYPEMYIFNADYGNCQILLWWGIWVRRERRSAAGRVEASAEEGRRRERVSKASSQRRPSERNVARRGEDGMGRSKAPACWKSWISRRARRRSMSRALKSEPRSAAGDEKCCSLTVMRLSDLCFGE